MVDLVDKDLAELTAWLAPLDTVEKFVAALKNLNESEDPGVEDRALRVHRKMQELSEEVGKGLVVEVEYVEGDIDVLEDGMLWHWDSAGVFICDAPLSATKFFRYEDISRFWLEV